MSYTGILIEESLRDRSVLDSLHIIETEVEPVTPEHQTPWVEQWTMHTVEIPADQIEEISEIIRKSLDQEHPWYADFKSETRHSIIFRDRVFSIDRSRVEEYEEATQHGISLGIPAYQVDFSPHIQQWTR